METVGSILRQRREALGLSLEEVQNRTKIRIRYLDALERGDYALLPGEVYARGFLRAYAEVLEIDPQPLLERLRREWGGLPATSEEPGSSGRELPAGRPAAREEETPPWRATPPQAERPGAAADEGLPGGGPTLPPRSRAPRPAPHARSRGRDRAAGPPARPAPPARSGLAVRNPVRLAGIAAGLLVLVAVVAYALWPRSPAAAPAGGPASAQHGGTPATTAKGGGGTATSETGGSSGGIAAQPPQVERVVSGQTVLYTLKGQGPLQLDVSFDDRVWLEVKADGKTVYSGTLSAGSRRSWTASRELDVVTARPYAMAVSLNGQSLGTPSQSTQVTYLVFVAGGSGSGTGGSGSGTGAAGSPGG